MMSTEFHRQEFSTFLSGLERRALASSISQRTFSAAMQGVQPLPDVLAKQAGQAEFTLSLQNYMSRVVPPARIRNGRAALKRQRKLFLQLEAEFRVEAEVIAAIWGIETRYGKARGDFPVIAALTTLAWKGRRAGFFESELIAALNIVQQQQADPGQMRGSWAGAMGHGQFMPSSYLRFAVDFDGDGKADIWGKDPTDGLASIANYLARHGWQRGAPWGCEVTLPKGFDFKHAGLEQTQSLEDWMAQGVALVDGGSPAEYGDASLLLPHGAGCPAFLTFANLQVLLRYNNAVPYALAVGVLADQLAGGKAPVAPWPIETPLNNVAISEMQASLSRAGFDAGKADGFMGPDTVRAIRGFQRAQGLAEDGHPDHTLLTELRAFRD